MPDFLTFKENMIKRKTKIFEKVPNKAKQPDISQHYLNKTDQHKRKKSMLSSLSSSS